MLIAVILILLLQTGLVPSNSSPTPHVRCEEGRRAARGEQGEATRERQSLMSHLGTVVRTLSIRRAKENTCAVLLLLMSRPWAAGPQCHTAIP